MQFPRWINPYARSNNAACRVDLNITNRALGLINEINAHCRDNFNFVQTENHIYKETVHVIKLMQEGSSVESGLPNQVVLWPKKESPLEFTYIRTPWKNNAGHSHIKNFSSLSLSLYLTPHPSPASHKWKLRGMSSGTISFMQVSNIALLSDLGPGFIPLSYHPCRPILFLYCLVLRQDNTTFLSIEQSSCWTVKQVLRQLKNSRGMQQQLYMQDQLKLGSARALLQVGIYDTQLKWDLIVVSSFQVPTKLDGTRL